MTFLHPLALVGLAAAAIPALLHLMQRRVPPELVFPALRYLSEAERRSARRLRLRHLLLLLLRTALIVAVVTAAARPLITRVGGGSAMHAPTAVVVILDNSPSAAAVIDGHPVLDRLKTAARAVLDRVASTDRAWLILADGLARAGSREALRAAVDSASVDGRRLELVAAVQRAVRLVDADPRSARDVYLVSDLQQSALGDGRVVVPRGVEVIALAPASGAALPNRGVVDARASDAGGAVAITIGGTPGSPPAAVTARVAGREIGRAFAAPGASLSFPLPRETSGWWTGEVELQADELRIDDGRPFVWHVSPPARVEVEPDAGAFVRAAVSVLIEGRHLLDGTDVVFADRPAAPSSRSVVLPPSDPSAVAATNRALATRDQAGRWRLGGPGTPGPIVASGIPAIAGVQVTRRYRLEGEPRDSGTILATVNGEPWLVKSGNLVLIGSRLDTTWTALPAAPGFVPFIDALANRFAAGADRAVTPAQGLARIAFAITGTDTVGATVFSPDPRESDLTPAEPRVIRRVLGADPLDDRAFAAAAFAGAERADLAGVLLLLAALLAGVELSVATVAR